MTEKKRVVSMRVCVEMMSDDDRTDGLEWKGMCVVTVDSSFESDILSQYAVMCVCVCVSA